MKKYSLALIFALMLSGCGTYVKVVQLTPQKADGWTLSHELCTNKCHDVDVSVRPVVMSYEDSGVEFLLLPIQTSDKKSFKDANAYNPSVEVVFRHWDRDDHIESCSLSFIEIEDQESSKRIHPVSVRKLTSGEHVTKYSTVCTYSFVPSEFLAERYNLYINEDALGCRFEPIQSIHEKKTHHFAYQLM